MKRIIATKTKLFLFMMLLIYLLTGGCVVVTSSDRYLTDYNIDYSPLITMRILCKDRSRGLPYFLTYVDTAPPFGLQILYYTQKIENGAQIRINMLSIQYRNQKHVDLTDRIAGAVELEHGDMSYVKNRISISKPCQKFSWTVPDCITEDCAFQVRLVGHVKKGDRIVDKFDVLLNYEPQHSRTDYFSTWAWFLISHA